MSGGAGSGDTDAVSEDLDLVTISDFMNALDWVTKIAIPLAVVYYAWRWRRWREPTKPRSCKVHYFLYYFTIIFQGTRVIGGIMIYNGINRSPISCERCPDDSIFMGSFKGGIIYGGIFGVCIHSFATFMRVFFNRVIAKPGVLYVCNFCATCAVIYTIAVVVKVSSCCDVNGVDYDKNISLGMWGLYLLILGIFTMFLWRLIILVQVGFDLDKFCQEYFAYDPLMDPKNKTTGAKSTVDLSTNPGGVATAEAETRPQGVYDEEAQP